MNALSAENLGTLSAPLVIDVHHGDARVRWEHQVSGLGQPQTDKDDFGENLAPDFAPWWKQIPARKDEWVRTRRNVQKGEAYKAADAYRGAWPMSPSNDERNLPTADGHPLIQYRHKRFTTNFPHTWIDYEKMVPMVGPDEPPMPQGWLPPPLFAEEEQRAISAVFPGPAVGPEDMARDISGMHGFASLQDLMAGGPGLGVAVSTVPIPSGVTTSIASAAQDAATQTAASGGSTTDVLGAVAQVIDLGSQIAAVEIQRQALAAARKITVPSPTLMTPVSPGAGGPSLLAIGGIAAAGLAVLAVALSVGGRRGRGTPRRAR